MATDIGELLVKLSADLKGLDSGLKQAKDQLSGFQASASSFASTLRNTLALAGVAVGIYEIAGALKSFATNAALTGARTETLQIAMTQVGKTYGMSAESLQFFVAQAKTAGITTQEAMLGVTKFLTSGLPLEQLQALATRARDIAVVAGTNTSEAFSRIVQGIMTGEQETLRRMMIQVGSTEEIYKRYAATLGKTKEDLNSVEKAHAMLNEVMRLTSGFAGVAAEADKSVGKQLQSMARFAEEAKNALWALFGPIMLEGVQQLTGGWKSLQSWAEANRGTLTAWGEAVAQFIQHKTRLISTVVQFISQSKEMILEATKLIIFFSIAKWVVAFTASLTGAISTMGIAIPMIASLQAACAGPFAIVITVAVAGLAYGINQIRNLHKQLDEERTKYEQSITPKITKPGDTFAVPKSAEVGIGPRGQISPELQKKLQIIDSEGKAQEEGKKAQKKASDEAPKPIGKAGGGKGGAAKETTDNLLAPLLAMYKTKREVELQDAQNSLDLLKTTNATKKAELDKSLAEGLIDGQTYYQRLQEMEKKETDGALAMIARKRVAQTKAYQESLTELAADTKLSAEAKSIATQKLAAENRKAISKLDTEAAQAKLEGETKVTNELKRQVDLRKQYADTTETMNIDTAQLLGAISEQEATLMKLNLEWKNNRDAALKAGLSPSDPYFAAGEKNLEAKKGQTLYGGYASAITTGISSIVDALMDGGADLKKAANSMFKGLFTESLKPGLDQLKGLLTKGFSDLFGEAGAGIASAVMGAIGLIGMLLTSSSSKSSYTADSVTSAVDSAESVRGLIAGETSLPIAEISGSLAEVMAPHLSVLYQIEANTRGSGGGASQVTLNYQSTQENRATTKETMDTYFREYLLQGAK